MIDIAHLRELERERTQGELEAECIGSEGYTLRMKFRGNAMEIYERFGFHGSIGEIRGGKNWAQLRGNAEYIVAACNALPGLLDIAEKAQRVADIALFSSFARLDAEDEALRELRQALNGGVEG